MIFEFIWMPAYLAVAVLALIIVRKCGSVSVSSGYAVECCYDESNGRDNVTYRIVAPPLCCGGLAYLLQVFCTQLSFDPPEHTYLATAIYWILMLFVKWRNRRLKGRTLLVLAEALVSVLMAAMFDRFILSVLPERGVDLFDSSNIAFQMELAAFYVLTGAIAARFIRLESGIEEKRNIGMQADKQLADSQMTSPSSRFAATVDTSETRLFSYERKYGSLLSERYDRDVLLRSLFFSIMAIEDANRPPAMRLGERLLSVFGLAKTTGIMQQGSDVPLSDADSVRLAVPYVERMRDRFLETYARSAESGYDGESLVFSGAYYKYSYRALVDVVQNRFSLLYGDYCGTHSLNANYVFRDVLRFEEVQSYGLMPATVSATGVLFSEETAWLSGHTCYWSASDCISSCEIVPNDACACAVFREGGVEAREIDEVTTLLKSAAFGVFEVKRAGAAAWIGCNGDAREVAQLVGPGWSVKGWIENGR